jgi:glycosyltransferase involved in cell wall biosynthesis
MTAADTTTSPGRTTLAPHLALRALDQRFEQAATILLDPVPDIPRTDHPGAVASFLLPALVKHCRGRGRPDARWLLLTAAFGAFPTPEQLLEFGRRLELQSAHVAQTQLLADVLADAGRGRLDLPMTVVTGGTLVDVDHSARNDTHTGIHRVVRETVPRWRDRHGAQAVAWIDQYSAFRALSPEEEARIFAYGRPVEPAPHDEAPAGPSTLVVPWRSTVVLVDVPNTQAAEQLAALARFSGNTLAMIGYDMIPITSAETRPFSDSVAFGQYLSVVKHAHRVAGISRSATAEFSGFAEAVRAQGLPGPTVGTVELVTEPPTDAPAAPMRSGRRPVVLATGSREPHKNQRAVLHAAERLWREGLDFEVRLVGGHGWTEDVLRPAADRLHEAGRPLTELGRVSDAELTAQLRAADLVVFVSLHEGYGLPVAEALACGTPVITADFGSQLEIARGGGCVVVGPRDDDALTDALRTLVTRPDERARLRAEIADRPVRTWAQYADELWAHLVRGEDAA